MKARIASLLRTQPQGVEPAGLLFGAGATVPSDAASGWQPGAIFQDTANGALYLNEGTLASCDFNKVASNGADATVDDLTVGGTLGVTGQATFTLAPTLTEEQAAGSETATLTNAPVTGNPTKYLKIKLGSTTYQFPVWALPA